MTSINNIDDLARILREQPEWADTIRSLLLSKELLDLPNRFAEFVEITNRNFQLFHERLERLETDLTTVKADVAILKTDMGQVKGQLGNALGINYEFKIEKNIASIAGRYLQVRRINVLKGAWTGLAPGLMDLIEQAEDDGIITGEQSYELGLTDIIIDGRRKDDASTLHVAAEISITIGDIDITRATERADILRAVINQPVIPAVIGSRIDDTRATMAAANNVTVILMPDD